MSIIRFVDREIVDPIDYEIAPMDGVLKYTLKKNLPESLPRDTFIYTIDTQELFHGAGYGLPIKAVYTDNEAKKTVVFYYGMLDSEVQSISIYTPFKGVTTQLHVSLGQISEEDLHIQLSNTTEELASVTIKSGESFVSLPLAGWVDNEPLKVVARGAISLRDISVLVDVVPSRND